MHDSNALLLQALRNQKTHRPPVWMMRQAGRYLPEYMELRRQNDFLTRCYNPEIAAEITLQPLRRFSFDAGIIFSDILLPLHKMGADLHFREGKGPQIDNPVRNREDVRKLKEFITTRDLPAVLEAIQICNEKASVPILGFAGAPFTMACYLIEGGGSRDWVETKRFMYRDPEGFRDLLNRLADAVGQHMQAQLDAGAVGVQLFDTWAGALSTEDFVEFAIPAARRAFSHVQGHTLYFTKDTGPFVHYLKEVGSSGVAIDWRIDMGYARQVLGDVPLQGNLDPIALQGPEEMIRRKVRQIIEKAGPKGHIFNLGHGCVPSTSIDGIHVVLDEVAKWKWTE